MTREEIINEINCLLFELDNGDDAVSYLTQNDVNWLKENIKALEQEPRWIPVTEKLPEEKTAVLLSCDDMYLAKLNPCIGWISGNNWYTFSARGSYLVKYPIAWMPLPEPYKAESEVSELKNGNVY